MKTCLFKFTENFTTKKWIFLDKKFWYFSYFCSKHRLWVPVKTTLRDSSNEYTQSVFWAEIRIIVYTPVNPSFFYIKVGFKGVKFIKACFCDAVVKVLLYIYFLFFRENKTWHFMWIICSSHEISTWHFMWIICSSHENINTYWVFFLCFALLLKAFT